MIHFVSKSAPRVLAVFLLVIGGCTSPDSGTATDTGSAAAPDERSVATAADGSTIVTFELTGDSKIGALQFDVDYAGATGRFAGDGDKVECKTLVAGALSSFNHLPGGHQLKAALVSVDGIQGPAKFAQCAFQGRPTGGQFVVTIKDASAPDLAAFTTPPDVKVTVAAG